MRPGDGNWHVSETLARLVEEQLVAAMWRLELRLYMLLAAAICASLAAHLFMLGQLHLSLDRAQREQRRARRRQQSERGRSSPRRQQQLARTRAFCTFMRAETPFANLPRVCSVVRERFGCAPRNETAPEMDK